MITVNNQPPILSSFLLKISKNEMINIVQKIDKIRPAARTDPVKPLVAIAGRILTTRLPITNNNIDIFTLPVCSKNFTIKKPKAILNSRIYILIVITF